MEGSSEEGTRCLQRELEADRGVRAEL